MTPRGNLLKVTMPGRSMLFSMQQTAVNAPSSASSSFEGLLAALTAPTPRTAWNNDDLAEDVATLSYEHALRAHARYSSADAGDFPFAQAAGPDADQATDASQSGSASSAQSSSLWAAPVWNDEAGVKPAEDFSTALDRNKKCASITIRLSKTECDQLRRRASQAGLTVSAYLRSCTFEAEALRAQVKDVL
ncbi:MAG: hypothetical protein WA802_15710, partial [Terracidiphilus sp.]